MPYNVNLKPKDTNKQPGLNILYMIFSGYGKYLLLFSNILLFGLYTYRFYLDRSNAILTSQIIENQAKIKSVEARALSYKKYADLADFIKEDKKQDVDSDFILNILTKTTPTGVEISNIEVENKQIKISSKSDDPVEFNTFISLLVSEERFNTVILESSSYLEENQEYNTSITIYYN